MGTPIGKQRRARHRWSVGWRLASYCGKPVYTRQAENSVTGLVAERRGIDPSSLTPEAVSPFAGELGGNDRAQIEALWGAPRRRRARRTTPVPVRRVVRSTKTTFTKSAAGAPVLYEALHGRGAGSLHGFRRVALATLAFLESKADRAGAPAYSSWRRLAGLSSPTCGATFSTRVARGAVLQCSRAGSDHVSSRC